MFLSLHGIYHLDFWVKKQGSNTKQKTWYSCSVLSIPQPTQKPTVTSHMVVKDISNYINIGLKESYSFKLKILFYFSDTFAVRNIEKIRQFITFYYFI